MKASTLKELARIIGAIPDDIRCDFTVEFDYKNGDPRLKCWTMDPKEVRAMFRENGVNRRWTKEYDDYNVTYFAKHLGMEIEITTPRGNVCRKVDTGKVETKRIPDYSNTPMKTVTEKVYEWVCK